MNRVCFLIMLIVMLIYADNGIWYCAEMHNLYSEEKRKHRGILSKFWDWLARKGEGK